MDTSFLTSALDRRRGLGEEGAALPQVFQNAPGVLSVLWMVVGANTRRLIIGQSLYQSRDLVPVALQAGRHNQVVIRKLPPAGAFHLIALGYHFYRGVAEPRDSAGDGAGHRPSRYSHIKYAGTNHGPQRLVIVCRSGLQNADVFGQHALVEQLGRHAAPAGAPTQNHDFMVVCCSGANGVADGGGGGEGGDRKTLAGLLRLVCTACSTRSHQKGLYVFYHRGGRENGKCDEDLHCNI